MREKKVSICARFYYEAQRDFFCQEIISKSKENHEKSARDNATLENTEL